MNAPVTEAILVDHASLAEQAQAHLQAALALHAQAQQLYTPTDPRYCVAQACLERAQAIQRAIAGARLDHPIKYSDRVTLRCWIDANQPMPTKW